MLTLQHTDLNELDALKQELKTVDTQNQLYPIGMKVCRVGSNTLMELPVVMKAVFRGKRVLMVVDDTPMTRAGKDLKKQVFEMVSAEGYEVTKLVLVGEPTVHADEQTIGIVKTALTGVDSVLVVGSGTVTDSTKDATYQIDATIPIVCVQTADSVNAMSDNLAVILRDGVKRTVQSRWVDGLIIDSETVRDAPPEMNVAGFCDLMALYTAPADYRLMYELNMSDFYSDVPRALTAKGMQEMSKTSSGILKGELESLDKLSTVLTLCGYGMAAVNTTACFSGADHVIPHLLDMDAGSKKQANALHGAQVAVSALVSTVIWQKLFQEFDPAAVDVDHCYPDETRMKTMVEMAFARIDPTGKIGAECWHDYEKKLQRWWKQRPVFEQFLANWPAKKELLSSLVTTPERMAEMMRNVGAPMRFSQLTPSKPADTARWAVYNCHLMRNRFNIIDLMFFLGWWNEDMLEEILSAAAVVGGGL